MHKAQSSIPFTKNSRAPLISSLKNSLSIPQANGKKKMKIIFTYSLRKQKLQRDSVCSFLTAQVGIIQKQTTHNVVEWPQWPSNTAPLGPTFPVTALNLHMKCWPSEGFSFPTSVLVCCHQVVILGITAERASTPFLHCCSKALPKSLCLLLPSD